MRKRSRECVEAHTTFVRANESNFKITVQQLTGLPTAKKKNAELIERPKIMKPVAMRPTGNKLCGNNCSWIDALIDSTCEDIPPICGISSLVSKRAGKDHMMVLENGVTCLDFEEIWDFDYRYPQL